MRGRKIVRKYLIHSPYKNAVKTTRYKKPRYTVRTLLKSPKIRDATIQEVVSAIETECKLICRRAPAPSKLVSSSAHSLTQIKWSDIMEELNQVCPILLSVLRGAVSTKNFRRREPAIVMAVAALMKSRSQKMSKLQAMVSSLLYSGHASKKVCCVWL